MENAHSPSAMRRAARTSAALLFISIVIAASACRIPGTSATGTASPARTATSRVSPAPSGPLDAAVPTPAAWPADVPVYPGARLTAGAAFSANGVTTWGMEWETLDAVDKVKAFYTGKLAQGDWSIQVNGGAHGRVAAPRSRKRKTRRAGPPGA